MEDLSLTKIWLKKVQYTTEIFGCPFLSLGSAVVLYLTKMKKMLLNEVSLHDMSRDARKPVFGVSDKV